MVAAGITPGAKGAILYDSAAPVNEAVMSTPPEGIVNWNAVVVEVETPEGIARYEHAMGTDKFVYGLDESVKVFHRITNIGDVDVVFPPNSNPRFNLQVRRDDELVWFWSADKPLRPESRTSVVVPPDSIYSISYGTDSNATVEREAWSLLDLDGELVSPGVFDVIAVAVVESTPSVSVGIRIVPEPASALLLLTLGGGLFVRRRCL